MYGAGGCLGLRVEAVTDCKGTQGSYDIEEKPCVLNGAVVSFVCTSAKMQLIVQFF